MSNKIKKYPYLKFNFNLMTMFLVFSTTLLTLFATILIITYSRFNDYKTLIYDITDNSIPKIIKTTNIYAHVKEFIYLNEKMRTSTTDIQRRITYQQIIYKILLINKFEIKVFNNKELEEKFSALKKEFKIINKIVQDEIIIRNKIKDKIQHIYTLDSYFIKQNLYPKLQTEFLEIINLTIQAHEEDVLDKLIDIKTKLNKKFNLLEENKKYHKYKEYLDEYKLNVLGKNGLIPLKLQELHLKDKSLQIESFVRNLIQKFVDKIEELSIEENNKLLKQSKENSNQLQIQMRYVAIIIFTGLIFLILFIYYIRQKIIKRLIALSENIQLRFQGSREEIIDNGHDEISSIVKNVNFFASKVQEQNEKLKELSLTDGLTKIANRRLFDIKFENELNMIKRYNHESAILMIDVDNFKLYNDNYGHSKGDECLKKLSEVLKSVVKREIDLVARYGGEEFICILSNTGEQKAKNIATSILKALADTNITHEYNGDFSFVTLSIGITMITRDDIKLGHSNIEKADEALYEAKRQGKNRYICYRDLETD